MVYVLVWEDILIFPCRSLDYHRDNRKIRVENPLEEFKRLHKFYARGFNYQTKELAKYLEVSPRTIQRWLKGKTRPRDEQLRKIESYLKNKQMSHHAR